MSSYMYLDTGALVRHAEALAEFPEPRAQAIAPHISSILNSGGIVACSEVTLVEFHDVITTMLRSPRTDHDDAWWERCRSELWSKIEDGRIRVLPTPSAAFDQVMALVTLATRTHGRKLRAWDALHLMIAARWAYGLNQKVKLITSDGDMDIAAVLGFDGQVEVVNLDVLARTGCGADKSTAR